MIATHALTKRYGRVSAVENLDLSVAPGDIYGFLGPNGSGKTTTVRMLLGLVLPTSGTVELLGERGRRGIARALPRVGALIEAPAAYGHLSARANLKVLDSAGPGGSLRSRGRRVDDALEQVGLAGIGRRPVKTYSLGMRQRLGIAAALLRRPELLVLDEPTNGLDPQGIHEVRDLLRALHDQGTTIFLSSHLLAEIEQLCGRVGVLDRGRLVLQQDLAALRAPTGRTVVLTPDGPAAARLLGSRLVERVDDRLVVDDGDVAALNRRLVRAGVSVTEIRAERRTLEQVVLAATGPSSDRVDRGHAEPEGRTSGSARDDEVRTEHSARDGAVGTEGSARDGAVRTEHSARDDEVRTEHSARDDEVGTVPRPDGVVQ